MKKHYNARGLRRTNFNNKWNCEFKQINGTLNGTFKAKQDAPDLVITNRLEKGTATISVLSHMESSKFPVESCPKKTYTYSLEGFRGARAVS